LPRTSARIGPETAIWAITPVKSVARQLGGNAQTADVKLAEGPGVRLQEVTGRQMVILPTMPNHLLTACPMKDSVTWLYPPIEPFNTGKLRVSPVHEIYFQESGKPSGKPVIFLHGRSRRWLRSQTAPLLPPRKVPNRELRPARLWEEHDLRVSGSEHHLGPGRRHRENSRPPRH